MTTTAATTATTTAVPMATEEEDAVEVPVEKVNPFLTCSICFGYFRDAQTIAECLHTCEPQHMHTYTHAPALQHYKHTLTHTPRTHHTSVAVCKVCIYRHFVNDEREIVDHNCPQCGIRLGTNPLESLRQDRLMQSIVDALFPNFAEEDRAAEAAFYAERGVTPPPASASREGFFGASGNSGGGGSGGYHHYYGGYYNGDADNERVKTPTVSRLVRGLVYDDMLVFKLVSGDTERLPQLPSPIVSATGRATVLVVLRLLARGLCALQPDIVSPDKAAQQLELRFRGEALSQDNTLQHIFEVFRIQEGRAPVITYHLLQQTLP